MPWSSHNMDPYTFEFVPQQEESTPGSIYSQPALVRPGDACTWDSSLWVYYQPDYVNRNNAQYPVVNNGNNDTQVVPTTSFGPVNDTTNITPPVAPFTQEPNLQEPLEADVIGNGVNSDETPGVHHQGREQDNPDTVFRCTRPGCRSTLGSKRSLTRHIKEKHDHPRAFLCVICQKSLSRKANLKDHLRRIHGFHNP
ncbi:hypothetical protein N7465_007546 [Penicillium sp. CMV-2018d]|nr:hypothetical protein N7465_007546 [Penicillium sp. CMV-2018d]